MVHRVYDSLLKSQDVHSYTRETFDPHKIKMAVMMTNSFMATMPRMGIEIPDAPRAPPVEEWHSKRLRLVNLFEID